MNLFSVTYLVLGKGGAKTCPFPYLWQSQPVPDYMNIPPSIVECKLTSVSGGDSLGED